MHFVDWLPTLVTMAGGDLTKSAFAHLDGIDHWESIRTLTSESRRREMLYTVYETMQGLVGAIR